MMDMIFVVWRTWNQSFATWTPKLPVSPITSLETGYAIVTMLRSFQFAHSLTMATIQGCEATRSLADGDDGHLLHHCGQERSLRTAILISDRVVALSRYDHVQRALAVK
jgi:hypothetical protein